MCEDRFSRVCSEFLPHVKGEERNIYVDEESG